MRVATEVLWDYRRTLTDSFNIVTQKSVKHYGMSSDETAFKLPIKWEETTEAKAVEVEAEVEVVLKESVWAL